MKNGLQHLAMNRGMQKKNQLWSAAGQRAFLAVTAARLGAVSTGKICWRCWPSWTSKSDPWRRRWRKRRFAYSQARLLMTQPGVGAITALAFVVTIGEVASVWARQTGGQLSGTHSARTQFGWPTTAGRNQQTGQ